MSNQEVSSKSGQARMNTGYLVRIAILSAVAFVVMYIEFPLGTLFPTFLQIDFSEIVVFVGGVALGPVAVIIIELLKNILHFFLKGSTFGIGEVANFIVGIALILPPVILVRRSKELKSGIFGFAIGIISMVVVASVLNYFVFLPLYKTVMNFDITYIFPTKWDSILYAFAPFNAIKGLIIAVPSLIMLKYIQPILKNLRLG